MLWKKESKMHDAFYVNLLTPGIDFWENLRRLCDLKIDQPPHPQKSDSIALEKRYKGNEKFRAEKWLDAIELYGDSLRFAPPKSEHTSLAYANRATCFLKLKMYDECLIDIDYAVAAGYPEHLKPKLIQRKENCLEQMQEDSQRVQMLTIEPGDQFPSINSNVAKVVHKNESNECLVVAKTDIDVGQMIAVENPFQKYLEKNFGVMCNICLKQYGNLVPCEKCVRPLFCPECQGDILHEYECGLNVCGDNDINNTTLSYVRFVLQVLNTFPSVHDLMVFVDQCHKNPNKWPSNLMNDQSKYQIYFMGTTNGSKPIDKSLKITIYSVYKTLLEIPKINEMFKSTKNQRFLMHLIAHDKMMRPKLQSINTCCNAAVDVFFKNSCYPNVYNFVNHHGNINCVSIKPIKQGEKLSISPIQMDIDSVQNRQMLLSNHGYGKCTCARCKGEIASLAQRQQMSNDPAYIYVSQNCRMVEINAKNLLHNCTTFLQKYGRMNWCDEIDRILQVFIALVRISDLDHPLGRARFHSIF